MAVIRSADQEKPLRLPIPGESLQKHPFAGIVAGRDNGFRLPVDLMLDAPAVPFAEGVVGPVPSVLFEKLDAVAQVLVGTRRPDDRGEFAAEDLRLVFLLEFPNGSQCIPQLLLVPAFPADDARIAHKFVRALFPEVAADELMRILTRLIHVKLINDVFQFDRREIGEGRRCAPQIGFHIDRGFRINFPDLLRRHFLNGPVIVFHRAVLVGLVDQVVAPESLLPPEAADNAAPDFQKMIQIAAP